MRHTAVGENAFETNIEQSLLQGGYQALSSDSYDSEKALFPETLIHFIKQTQPKVWNRLEALLGERTESQVINDLCKWTQTHGALSTLRHGFKCYGKKLYVAFFKAAHTMNPELIEAYEGNVLGITRQLYYSSKNRKSLDVCISLNGFPIATLELKNPLTGQTVWDAIKQYRDTRDPREPLFEFKHRCLVHFAVDPDQVYMTTRLAGSSTYFLPFNKGRTGGLAGNPEDTQGRDYKTGYLWEEVLAKDSLLDLLARFIHLEIEEKRTDEGRKVKKEKMIFPRYHQLQAVRNIVTVAENEGAGNNYLVEHSAGSGKSNTIAWLAHRLSSLHNADNDRVFDSVVVITDRRVLDKQLQDTIYQFEHKLGVVEKIDKHSSQLAEALEGGKPIIITTLQKFPFVRQQLIKLAEKRGESSEGVLPARKFAVIIDEAHSSQGGETAADLKEVLGGESLVDKAKKQAKEEDSTEEEVYRSMARRGQQENVSFFAFTATPKHKTLKVFGRNGEAFHRYTMRQAIEEGFILDVLKNYTTYETYYKLLKSGEDDREVERKKAAKALARFVRIHPHNIAQKTEVMVEHFYAVTQHRIGGKAKAMVVTGSRLEAVRYKQAFDKYIREKGYKIKSLVAFSGEVQDDKLPDVRYSEVAMNDGIKEKELPDKFATPGYHVLLVAEKYQTGFDQPLLHTMYIDRRLAGIQAVQTLSRLNRTHPLKEDTFVLDFVNDREEIKAAFETYYEGAEMGEEADADRLYQIKAELDASGIYHEEEIAEFCRIYFKPKKRQNASDHKDMNAALSKPVLRFTELLSEEEEAAELLRGKIQSFRNLYSFLSQVIPYQDSDLEKLYIFLRHLSSVLPRRKGSPDLQLDGEVVLEYYRLQKISEGSIKLGKDYPLPLDGPVEVGTGMVREDPVTLSSLVDRINDRFGTDFNSADQLLFDQIFEVAAKDESIITASEVNPKGKFLLIFKNLLVNLFIERMDQNEGIFARFMNDKNFQSTIIESMGEDLYWFLKGNNSSKSDVID